MKGNPPIVIVMAYSFFLTGSNFDRSAWLRDLKSTYVNVEQRPGFPLSTLGCQLADIHPNWHRDRVWLHPADGVGGITIHQNNDGVRLELSDCCASADVGMAWELIRLAMKEGAVASDESLHELTGVDEEIAKTTHAIQATCWLRLVAEILQAGELTLLIGDLLSLRVSKEDTADGSIGLERKLVERMRRYSHAVIAGVMTPSDPTRSPFCIYSEAATLFPSSVGEIYVHVDGARFFSRPIPAEKFYGVLRGQTEDLGERIFVPAIDLSADLCLVLSLKPDSPPVDDLVAGSESGLTAAEWARLAKAPCLVFMMMISAEGKIDELEIERFERLLNEPGEAPTPWVARVIGISRQNIEGLVAEILSVETTPPMELLAIQSLLESGRIPATDAKAFARFLYLFAESIASASGGFLGLGRISKREAEALETLRRLLLLD